GRDERVARVRERSRISLEPVSRARHEPRAERIEEERDADVASGGAAARSVLRVEGDRSIARAALLSNAGDEELEAFLGARRAIVDRAAVEIGRASCRESVYVSGADVCS